MDAAPVPRQVSSLRAGLVGRAHGLDGSFYVNQPKPQLLLAGAVVMIGESSWRIVRRAGDDRRPIVRVEGIEDRSAAQGLVGLEIFVSRNDAPKLEPEEWWAEDLEGCLVQQAGSHIGTVRRLLALPSCEVLEVERSGSGEVLLVPLVVDAVRSVDIARKEIEVDLGFLGED